MLVLVCGDRNWKDYRKVEAELRTLPADTTVMHGACRGADLMAASAAMKLGLLARAFPADWSKGRGAGPQRNLEMLNQKPDLVLAFHRDLSQSKGTAHTVREARKRGIPVKVIL